MKKIMCLFLLVQSVVTFAAEQFVTLSIPSMDCPVCPITIKKSLQKVSGVKSVDVSYQNKTAIVSFDNQLTDTDKLLKATENVGYPSVLEKDKK